MKNNIFHLDMDCFFASVETIKNPHYKNIPMCVGGRFYNGVVSSANYVARKKGVKSAMPLYEAKKICPELLILDCNYAYYDEISNEINQMLSSILKKVERGSVDEWYFDTNDSEFESWDEFEFASYIKNLIKKKFSLPCSIGNSFTTFLAKTATDLCKPDGFLTLNKNNYMNYLKKINLKDLFGIGQKTLIILNEYNIKTVDDILNFNNDVLIQKRIGIVWSKLKFNLLGIETNPINKNYKRKNIGKNYTIKKFTEYQEFFKLIKEMVESINNSLIENKFLLKSVNMKIKFKDNDYFSKSISYDDFKDNINYIDLIYIFEQNISEKQYQSIYNIAITAFNLVEYENYKSEENMFDSINKELSPIEKIAIKVNQKFDKDVVVVLSKKNN